MEKQKQISVSTLIDQIVAGTLTRHAKMSEDEFLKDLKIEGKTEKKAILDSKFALVNAITREILYANDKIKLIDGTFKLIFDLNKEEKGE